MNTTAYGKAWLEAGRPRIQSICILSDSCPTTMGGEYYFDFIPPATGKDYREASLYAVLQVTTTLHRLRLSGTIPIGYDQEVVRAAYRICDLHYLERPTAIDAFLKGFR
jgi:hypothetical protein